MENQASQGDQFLSNIIQYIEDNIGNESLTVEDLAQNVGLSRSMLHRRLIKLTGKSASDHITEIRLNRAKNLLENDVATVSEIAFRVGFNDPSYFNKVFKKYFQVSPGKIRKNCVAPNNHISIDKKTKFFSSDNSTRNRLFVKAIYVLLLIIGSGVGFYIYNFFWTSEKSIAVLPLHNLTGQPENDYFIDGMHDALIGELGQIESLRVISRTSTLQYRDSNMLLKNIANELGVNTIVEGSVTGIGDSLRVLIQLIDVFPKERHLLANEYCDDMHNILNIQSSVVKDIAHKIRIKLSKDEEQQLADLHSVDPETYKDFLRGMYHLNQGTEESFETGINFLIDAIERDPGDPFAYAGLALGYAIRGHGMVVPEKSFRSATAAAKKALKIDPTLDEAYTALALIYLYQYWDWPMAREAFENALANNPNNEIAHAHYAYYYVLFGNLERAIYHAEKSVELNPFSASYHSWLAWLYYYNEDFDNAEISARKSLELKDDIPYGNLVLGWTYLQKKQYQEAINLHEKLPIDDDYFKMLLACTYVQAGDREKALGIWNELLEYSKNNWVNPFYTGMLAATLGFTDIAFELINEACDNKYYPALYIDIFPGANLLRDDPRYNLLRQKLNLPYSRALLTAKP